MALDKNFLDYPNRKHGMDHDRYLWRNMFDLQPVLLDNDARLAFLVTIPIEFFPLNPSGNPFKAPGSMVTQYPDYRHYSTRDYGNRVGIYRLLKKLETYNIKANIAMNAEVAVRYPQLLQDIIGAGHEIVAHGIDMDTLHYGGIDECTESDQVTQCLKVLRSMSGQKVNGWMSPAYSESFNTPDIVSENDCTYICDWSNDDLPYTMQTRIGQIIAMPVSQEISDRQIIINYHQTEDSFVTQVMDQFDMLYQESARFGARVLSLTLTPYISGLPFRIAAVDQIFNFVMKHSDVISMTGSEIITKLKINK